MGPGHRRGHRHRPQLPIVADPDRKVAELYDMIHPGEGDTSTVRSVFIIDPAGKIRLVLTYRALVLDAVVESSRVGVRKPDPRFYELACEQLAIEPTEAVFLDDLGVNLKPARALGMTTIMMTVSSASMRKHLALEDEGGPADVECIDDRFRLLERMHIY